jgi:hypothetical protein
MGASARGRRHQLPAEQTGFAPHLAYLAEFLAQQGHVVTVLTGFPFAPLWKRWPGHRGRLFSRGSCTASKSFVRPTSSAPSGAAGTAGADGGSFVPMTLASLAKSRRAPWDIVVYCGAQPAWRCWCVGWPAAWRSVCHQHSRFAAQAAADVGIVKHRSLRGTWSVSIRGVWRGGAGLRALPGVHRFVDRTGFPREAIHLLIAD